MHYFLIFVCFLITNWKTSLCLFMKIWFIFQDEIYYFHGVYRSVYWFDRVNEGDWVLRLCRFSWLFNVIYISINIRNSMMISFMYNILLIWREVYSSQWPYTIMKLEDVYMLFIHKYWNNVDIITSPSIANQRQSLLALNTHNLM